MNSWVKVKKAGSGRKGTEEQLTFLCCTSFTLFVSFVLGRLSRGLPRLHSQYPPSPSNLFSKLSHHGFLCLFLSASIFLRLFFPLITSTSLWHQGDHSFSGWVFSFYSAFLSDFFPFLFLFQSFFFSSATCKQLDLPHFGKIIHPKSQQSRESWTEVGHWKK